MGLFYLSQIYREMSDHIERKMTKMARQVVIDTEECIGCESCVELCADVFSFNEDEEKAEVILPQGGSEDCIEEAIETCPVECIHWED